MVEAKAALREGIKLITFGALKGRLTAGEDFHVNFHPANALLISEVPHEGHFVDTRGLENMLSKPGPIHRVVGL